VLRVQIRGENALNMRIAGITPAVKAAAGEALYAAATDAQQLAVQLAPKEDGHLESAAFVEDPVVAKGKVSLFAGFFSTITRLYAIVQHEDTTLNHPGPRALAKGVNKVGVALFLKRAFEAKSGRITATVAAYVKSTLAGLPVPKSPRSFPKSNP
jgi:hypothetical protein